MSRPLRVCHLAYTFYDSDNRVIRYAEALAERGAEVEVIGLRRPGQSLRGESNGVRIHRIQRRAITEKSPYAYLVKLLWFLLKSSALLTVLQIRKPYDIVHVHNVPDFLVFAAWAPKLMGARIILDIHDILPELYSGKFGSASHSTTFRALLRIERLSCRFADHVIVANHLWHERLQARTVPPGKCTAILNYPDLRLFTRLPEHERRPDGVFVMLYPGTLNHHQGLDIAIKAFSRVKDRMPHAEFRIYGEGPARPALGRLIDELDLMGRVKLMDRVPLSDVWRLMAAADVGIVPKRADGFGNEAFSTKIFEFMACEVPVIVSRTQVDAYYFNDDVVRFFAPGDDADLARAMRELYEHRSDRADRVRAARDLVVRYSWQAHLPDYLNVVERLMAPLPGPTAVAP